MAEEIVIQYLKQKGYKILYRNFIIRKTEIDIICKTLDYIVVIEVKFRRSFEYFQWNHKQQKRLMKFIEEFFPYEKVRLDFVYVYYDHKQNIQIEHIKNVSELFDGMDL